MIYSNFKDKKLSQLGFGTMRLPTDERGEIDMTAFQQMTDLAIASGVNYFDTAWPYHGGKSEIATGMVLSKYPRDSYYLASKYPGHQISESYDPKSVFEEQLRKCGVDYFDFYLLHNVYENSIDTYFDERWGIIDYFREQKRHGRIKHLGFSTHGSLPLLERFLERVGDEMEFCQIQLNWMDWTLQDGKQKVELLNRYNIPVWVMEPVRGGRLCTLSEKNESVLKSYRPEDSIASWGFRFLQDIEGVTVILSGMSNLDQMRDNLSTFECRKALSDAERDALLAIAEEMKQSVPCTACRYCTDGCPMGLDIPHLIATYNELAFEAKTNATMWLESLDGSKQPSACIGCGACSGICPQKLDIPEVLRDLTEKLKTVPKWTDICREREAAAKALAEGNK